MSKSTLYHSHDYATLTMENESGDETVVAGVQGVTITPNQSVDQFYTADSTIIVDQIQYERAVDVEIEFAFFDGDIAKEWLGGSGTTANTLSDETNPELFQLATYTHPSRDGSNEIDISVDNITFEEMPLVEWSEGDYVSYSLSGIGEDISNFEVTTPA